MAVLFKIWRREKTSSAVAIDKSLIRNNIDKLLFCTSCFLNGTKSLGVKRPVIEKGAGMIVIEASDLVTHVIMGIRKLADRIKIRSRDSII